MNFAKVFDVDGDQLLVVVDEDDDGDDIMLAMMRVKDVMIRVACEEKDSADVWRVFAAVDEDTARRMVKMIKALPVIAHGTESTQ